MLSSLLRRFLLSVVAGFRLFLSLKKLFFQHHALCLNITIDKSLFICTIECAIFFFFSKLVDELPQTRHKTSVGFGFAQMSVIFCMSTFLIRQRTLFIKGSQFYRQRVWAVADSHYRGTGSRKGWFEHRNVPAGWVQSYASSRFLLRCTD